MIALKKSNYQKRMYFPFQGCLSLRTVWFSFLYVLLPVGDQWPCNIALLNATYNHQACDMWWSLNSLFLCIRHAMIDKCFFLLVIDNIIYLFWNTVAFSPLQMELASTPSKVQVQFPDTYIHFVLVLYFFSPGIWCPINLQDSHQCNNFQGYICPHRRICMGWSVL